MATVPALPRPPYGHSPQEEANIARMKSDLDRREDRLREIDLAIENARQRRQDYKTRGLERDVEIQNDIIDRRLRERFEVQR